MKLESELFRLQSFKNHLKWYQIRTDFLGTKNGKFTFQLLRRRNCGRASSGIFEFFIRWCVFKFSTFWYQIYGRGSTREKVVARKTAKNGYYVGETCVGWHISVTHAISKIEQKFKNRISRELNQNFDIRQQIYADFFPRNSA